MDHRLKVIGYDYKSWAHVPSRVTASVAKLRDQILLSCIEVEVPARSSEPGQMKIPQALQLPEQFC